MNENTEGYEPDEIALVELLELAERAIEGSETFSPETRAIHVVDHVLAFLEGRRIGTSELSDIVRRFADDLPQELRQELSQVS